jgi:sugar phosphate isomerase/epimerase
MSEVVIVASAFGVDAIRRDGHEAWLETAAQAGAKGFEVRRELFACEAQTDLTALRSLGAAIDGLGMWSVYSTPAALYTATGALDAPALRVAVEEADALGARFVKLQLGGFGADDANRPRSSEQSGNHSNRPTSTEQSGNHSNRPMPNEQSGNYSNRPISAERSGNHSSRPTSTEQSGNHSTWPTPNEQSGNYSNRPTSAEQSINHLNRGMSKPEANAPQADHANSCSAADNVRNSSFFERTTAHGAQIAACMRDVRARLVVENGQLAQGGMICQFVGLFDALRYEGYADVLGMTFDLGNWQWPGESPVEAARQLTQYVEYIHCKAVTGVGARRFAVAPVADDPLCAAVLRLLPRDVPRGIEFPFDPKRVAAQASHYVGWLAEA